MLIDEEENQADNEEPEKLSKIEECKICWEDGKLVICVTKGKRKLKIVKPAKEIRVLRDRIKSLIIHGQRKNII